MSVYYPLGRGDEMSEGEYQYQLALCDEAGRPDAVPAAPKGRWRVRGGALLEIRGMTDAHLRNAIAFFERRGDGQDKKIGELRIELKKRER